MKQTTKLRTNFNSSTSSKWSVRQISLTSVVPREQQSPDNIMGGVCSAGSARSSRTDFNGTGTSTGTTQPLVPKGENDEENRSNTVDDGTAVQTTDDVGGKSVGTSGGAGPPLSSGAAPVAGKARSSVGSTSSSTGGGSLAEGDGGKVRFSSAKEERSPEGSARGAGSRGAGGGATTGEPRGNDEGNGEDLNNLTGKNLPLVLSPYKGGGEDEPR